MTEKQWIALDEVVLWDENPNQGDIGAIISMIRQFGYRWPIGLMDGKVTKAGNHRTQALRMLRDEIVGQDEERWEVFGPCIRIAQDGTWEIEYIDHSDLTEAQSNAFALADNRAVRLGHDNMEQLATLLKVVYHDEDIPIDATGFSTEDLDDLNYRLSGGFNAEDEWAGMPEFEQGDISAPYSIRVNFNTIENLQAFSKLIGQTITDKTKYIYYPKQEKEKYGHVLDES